MRKYLINQDLMNPVQFHDCLHEINGFYKHIGSDVFETVRALKINFLMPVDVDETIFDGEDVNLWQEIAKLLLDVKIVNETLDLEIKRLNMRLLILLLRQHSRVLFWLCEHFATLYQEEKFGQVYSMEEFLYKVEFSEEGECSYEFTEETTQTAYYLARHIVKRATARIPPIETLLSRHGEMSFLERFSTVIQKCCVFVGGDISASITARIPTIHNTPDFSADLRLRTLYRIIFKKPLTNASDLSEVRKRQQLYALLSYSESLADLELECLCQVYATALECESCLEVVNMLEAEPGFADRLRETNLKIDYEYGGLAFKTLFGEFPQNALDVVYAIGEYLQDCLR